MIKIVKRGLINTNIIGKAYIINNKEITTFFVIYECNEIVFVNYFKRGLSASMEKEMLFLENMGFKPMEEWIKKISKFKMPVVNNNIIKKKIRGITKK